MIKPEYWADDEKWAAWEQWEKDNPDKDHNVGEPLSGLGKAIAKARGDIICEQDMIDQINFCN